MDGPMEILATQRRMKGMRASRPRIGPPAVCLALLFLLPAALHAASERSLIHEGNRLYDEKQYADAEANYRKALEADKDLREGVFNLGDAFYKQGRFKEAEDKFRETAEKAKSVPLRSKAYHNLGNSLLKEKKLEDSINAYKQALKLNPGEYDTQYNLEYARQLLKQQKQKQQQQSQSDKKEQKEQQQKEQQREKEQQQQKSQQQEQQKKEQQEGQRISREDAERILEALSNEEKNVQKKVRKKKAAGKVAVEKNW
jgi:Ca-activated chloride channel family protein